LSEAQAQPKVQSPAEKPPAPKAENIPVEKKSKAKKPAASGKAREAAFKTQTEDVASVPIKVETKVEAPAVETAAKKTPVEPKVEPSVKPKAEATAPVKVSAERKAFDEFYKDLEDAQELGLDPAKRIDAAVEKGYIKQEVADEAIQMLEDNRDIEGAYDKILASIDTYDTNLTAHDTQKRSNKPKNKSRNPSFKDETTPPIDPPEAATKGFWSPEETAARKDDLLSKRI